MAYGMTRDEFPTSVKDALSKRVAFRCSNPKCGVTTSGPHTEATRYVNLGVASHITAAASGGPRFDESLTPEERVSIDNGIWLCQRCGKLVDNDPSRYSVTLLRAWKVSAEARALRALAGDLDPEFFPQPPLAVHTPIPKIAGLTYDEARTLLLQVGWQPRSRHWSHGSDPNVRAGNGMHFWQKGYWELINAWPTGLARCTFAFHDVYGNFLTVVTVGEVIEELGATAYVCNWYFTKDEA
jgi:hypothetical protein